MKPERGQRWSNMYGEPGVVTSDLEVGGRLGRWGAWWKGDGYKAPIFIYAISWDRDMTRLPDEVES